MGGAAKIVRYIRYFLSLRMNSDVTFVVVKRLWWSNVTEVCFEIIDVKMTYVSIS